MGLRVAWVRYGREGATALRRAISDAKAGDPLSPVTVVVPSNSVGVAARRLLASGAVGPICAGGVGLAAVTFVTPYRLAELSGSPTLAATGRRPISTPVLTAAVRRALGERAGLFSGVAGHAATEGALVSAYRELRDLSPAALHSLAGTGLRAAEVVRLHRSARAFLEPRWYDEEDLMTAATAVVDGGGTAAGVGDVIVYLPQRLTRHAALLVGAMGRLGDVPVLAGSVGDDKADGDVVASLHRLGLDPAPGSALATGLTVSAMASVVAPERTSFVTASDADDEVRGAVRRIVDAVRAGTRLDRIAILHASPDPYARLVHEHLSAAGIAVNGPAVVAVAERVEGRALLQLLALPEGGFRRDDVFAWLSAAPIRHEDAEAPVSAWERLSRSAAVVRGRDDWDGRLAHLADDLDRRAARMEGQQDADGRQVEELRADAARARALRAFVLALIDDLTAAAAGRRSWAEHAGWASSTLDRLLGAEGRASWPAVEQRAAERVDLALDRLAALDEVEDGVPLDAFTRTLALELESDLGRVGRFGEGVLVGPVAMGAGLDLDLVVVLGLAEGTFPAAVRDDSLLPDHERIAASGELALRSDRVARDHRDLLASLAGAGQHILGVPRGDLRRSTQRVASRWALDAASALAGVRWWSSDLLTADVAWVHHVPSFAAGIRALSFPATEQEHRLRSLLAVGAGDGVSSPGFGDPVMDIGADVLRARRSSAFTRFDGHVHHLAIPSPVESAVSATSLQRWAECPFDYFLRDVLGVATVADPEEALTISRPHRGDLVHEILERFTLQVLARPAGEQPGPDEPWSPADHERLHRIARGCFDDYDAQGLTGRPIFWRRDMAAILQDLGQTLLRDDTYRRDNRTRPLAAELSFGYPWSVAAEVPFGLPDGRTVRFRGKADRVDEAEDGSLHVVDYKSGKVDDHAKKLTADEPDQRGRRLQLAVYGVAARVHRDAPHAAVRADYWFVSRRGEFKRIGYQVTDAVLDRVRATVGTLIDGIEGGIFPSHPMVVSTSPRVECESCDPDALGVSELRQAWERKRHDPALAPFADFTEPPEVIGPPAEETDVA